MRLVDADKIKKCLEWDKLDGYQERDDMEDWELIDVKYSQGFNAGIDRAIYYLENEKMQAKHGRWIINENIPCCYCCSECGHRVFLQYVKLKYCPDCGCKMDKDE